MKLTPFKFIVQSVLMEVNDSGAPVGERVSEQGVVYGIEGLEDLLAQLKSRLDEDGYVIPEPSDGETT